MVTPCVESLWAEADAFRESEGIGVHADDEVDSEAEDEFGNNLSQIEARDICERVVRLPNGDLHCCGADCEFAVADKSGFRVCTYTGRAISTLLVQRTTLCTGRSQYSTDPDVHAGSAVGGTWRKKRDMMKASCSAFRRALELDDAEMPRPIASVNDAPRQGKRGALCVDEAPPPTEQPKRIRLCKKNVAALETRVVLMKEAATIFAKLLDTRRDQADDAAATASLLAIDPRLLNRSILFEAALKKHVKETLSRGGLVLMDDVHNISLAVDRVLTEELSKRARIVTVYERRVHETEFQTKMARLALSVWIGACQTPFMSRARRGADSFRPFCAGVFYGLKRGVTLADGTAIVPKCDDFVRTLPSAKAINADAALKSLHASSHRGLSSLHKCLGSVDATEARHVFADAIRIAASV